MTVLGPVAAGDLGFTQPHEHILVDLFDMKGSYDGILEDRDVAAAEVGAFAAAGGRTIVDTTAIGIGRDPLGLAMVARATGVNVVMGTGWYREAVYAPEVLRSTSRALADRLIEELETGVGDTGIRPGVIGELGTERSHITPAQERVFRAAALASIATNTTITTHTSHYGELAMEQVGLLTGEGVAPERIVIGHLGDRHGLDLERPVLATGAWVEIDHVGFPEYQTDDRRADHIATLVAEGHVARLLLASDTCLRSQLHALGGRGYDHLIRDFLPRLRARGVPEDAIQRMTVDNPARAFARPDASDTAPGAATIIRDVNRPLGM
jgi:predicted metal-dependent phosphotriesterase family hydrolase